MPQGNPKNQEPGQEPDPRQWQEQDKEQASPFVLWMDPKKSGGYEAERLRDNIGEQATKIDLCCPLLSQMFQSFESDTTIHPTIKAAASIGLQSQLTGIPIMKAVHLGSKLLSTVLMNGRQTGEDWPHGQSKTVLL